MAWKNQMESMWTMFAPKTRRMWRQPEMCRPHNQNPVPLRRFLAKGLVLVLAALVRVRELVLEALLAQGMALELVLEALLAQGMAMELAQVPQCRMHIQNT
jgi:hypothetical protein